MGHKRTVQKVVAGLLSICLMFQTSLNLTYAEGPDGATEPKQYLGFADRWDGSIAKTYQEPVQITEEDGQILEDVKISSPSELLKFAKDYKDLTEEIKKIKVEKAQGKTLTAEQQKKLLPRRYSVMLMKSLDFGMVRDGLCFEYFYDLLNFFPIGSSERPFVGEFSGLNEESTAIIRGLYLQSLTGKDVGFFGHIENAHIHDILLDGDVLFRSLGGFCKCEDEIMFGDGSTDPGIKNGGNVGFVLHASGDTKIENIINYGTFISQGRDGRIIDFHFDGNFRNDNFTVDGDPKVYSADTRNIKGKILAQNKGLNNFNDLMQQSLLKDEDKNINARYRYYLICDDGKGGEYARFIGQKDLEFFASTTMPQTIRIGALDEYNNFCIFTYVNGVIDGENNFQKFVDHYDKVGNTSKMNEVWDDNPNTGKKVNIEYSTDKGNTYTKWAHDNEFVVHLDPDYSGNDADIVIRNENENNIAGYTAKKGKLELANGEDGPVSIQWLTYVKNGSINEDVEYSGEYHTYVLNFRKDDIDPISYGWPKAYIKLYSRAYSNCMDAGNRYECKYGYARALIAFSVDSGDMEYAGRYFRLSPYNDRFKREEFNQNVFAAASAYDDHSLYQIGYEDVIDDRGKKVKIAKSYSMQKGAMGYDGKMRVYTLNYNPEKDPVFPDGCKLSNLEYKIIGWNPDTHKNEIKQSSSNITGFDANKEEFHVKVGENVEEGAQILLDGEAVSDDFEVVADRIIYKDRTNPVYTAFVVVQTKPEKIAAVGSYRRTYMVDFTPYDEMSKSDAQIDSFHGSGSGADNFIKEGQYNYCCNDESIMNRFNASVAMHESIADVYNRLGEKGLSDLCNGGNGGTVGLVAVCDGNLTIINCKSYGDIVSRGGAAGRAISCNSSALDPDSYGDDLYVPIERDKHYSVLGGQGGCAGAMLGVVTGDISISILIINCENNSYIDVSGGGTFDITTVNLVFSYTGGNGGIAGGILALALNPLAKVKIENCHNKGNLDSSIGASSLTSGTVAKNINGRRVAGTCWDATSISTGTGGDGGTIGGIVGISFSILIIIHCKNSGRVNAGGVMGGSTGMGNATSTIKNKCHTGVRYLGTGLANGGKGGTGGGLVGTACGRTILNNKCINEGEVIASGGDNRIFSRFSGTDVKSGMCGNGGVAGGLVGKVAAEGDIFGEVKIIEAENIGNIIANGGSSYPGSYYLQKNELMERTDWEKYVSPVVMLEGAARNGGNGGAGGTVGAAIGQIDENGKVDICKFVNRGKLFANGGNGGTGVPIDNKKCCGGFIMKIFDENRGENVTVGEKPCELENIEKKGGTGGKGGPGGFAGIIGLNAGTLTGDKMINLEETCAIGGNAGNGGNSSNVNAGDAGINAGPGGCVGIIAKCLPGSITKLLNCGVSSTLIINGGTYGAPGIDTGDEGNNLNGNLDKEHSTGVAGCAGTIGWGDNSNIDLENCFMFGNARLTTKTQSDNARAIFGGAVGRLDSGTVRINNIYCSKFSDLLNKESQQIYTPYGVFGQITGSPTLHVNNCYYCRNFVNSAVEGSTASGNTEFWRSSPIGIGYSKNYMQRPTFLDVLNAEARRNAGYEIWMPEEYLKYPRIVVPTIVEDEGITEAS